MTGSGQETRLHELREKTDRQLMLLINGRLHWAAGHARAGWRASAEQAYAEAARLLPWVEGLTAADRALLEAQVSKLRRLLDEAAAA